MADSAIKAASPFVSLTWHPAAVLTLDIFFDLNWGTEGLAAKDDAWRPNAGQQQALTGLGAFFGELMRREFAGSWQSDPQYPDDVLRARLALKGGAQVYPFSRAWKRMKCGAAESFEALYQAVRQATKIPSATDEARGWIEQALFFERVGRLDLSAAFCDRATEFGLDADLLAQVVRLRSLARAQAASVPAPVPGSAPVAAPATKPALSTTPGSEPRLPLTRDTEATLAQADALTRTGAWAAALAAFDRALELEPAVKMALIGRARALIALSRLAEARSWLESFSVRDDCEPERSLLAATAAARVGDLRDAHDLLRRVADNAHTPELHRTRAAARAAALAEKPQLRTRVIEQMEDLNQAVQAYQDVCRQHPDYAQGWRDFGVALSLAGRGEEALPHFRHAANLEPNEPKSYDQLAVTLARLSRLEEAIAVLDEGLRQCPGDVALTFRKGILSGSLGRNAEALALFAQVIQQDPAHPDVWANQADIELRLQQIPQAINSIEHYLHNNPARIGPRMQAAREKLWSLRNPGASRDPTLAQELSDRSNGLVALFGDHAGALRDLEAATQADPLNGHCWFNRAVLLVKLGRREEALASCQQAESILGATAQVTDVAVALLLQLGRVDAAIQCHDRNLVYGKPSADRLHAKAQTLIKVNRASEALALLQTLIAKKPFDVALRRERASALSNLGRRAEAAAAQETIKALAANDPGLRAN